MTAVCMRERETVTGFLIDGVVVVSVGFGCVTNVEPRAEKVHWKCQRVLLMFFFHMNTVITEKNDKT